METHRSFGHLHKMPRRKRLAWKTCSMNMGGLCLSTSSCVSLTWLYNVCHLMTSVTIQHLMMSVTLQHLSPYDICQLKLCEVIYVKTIPKYLLYVNTVVVL